VRTTYQRETLVIRDVTTLVAWRSRLGIRPSRHMPVVELRLPELAPAQNRCFSTLATEYQNACGCGTGRAFMIIAITATIGYFAIHHHIRDLELRHAAMLVVIAAGAAITGKLTGKLWARLRLTWLVMSVQRASRLARQAITSST
jgi:hypothetical protein